MRLGRDLNEVLDRVGPVTANRTVIDGVEHVGADLAAHIYAELYTRPVPLASPRCAQGPDGELLEALAEAHGTHDRWSGGWTLTKQEGPHHWGVSDGALELFASHVQIRSPRELRAGDPCDVRVPTEARTQRGWWHAWGEADDLPGAKIRIYVALRAHEAPAYIAALTTRMNHRQLPFQTKVPDSPLGYLRADAAVLYLPQSTLRTAWPTIRTVLRPLSVRPHTPMFTYRVAPGIALGEDTASGLSFGDERCRLIAKALQAVGARSAQPHRAVARRWSEAGLDPRRPYLRNRRRVSFRWLRDTW